MMVYRAHLNKNYNSAPSSFLEIVDRCPTCGDAVDVEKDLNTRDECRNCVARAKLIVEYVNKRNNK